MKAIFGSLGILALVASIAMIVVSIVGMRYRQGPAVAVFAGFSTSAAPAIITTLQRTPQAALPVRSILPAGSLLAGFSVTNTSKSALTLFQPYRIEMHVGGAWQEFSRGMFSSNQFVTPGSSASFSIPAPAIRSPWRVVVQYIHQGTLRSRLEGGPGKWRLLCVSETVQPDK